MHPLLHKLKPAAKEVMKLLNENPKKTPAFDVSIHNYGTFISAMGPTGKKFNAILYKHGFNSGYTFTVAFYLTLEALTKRTDVCSGGIIILTL